MIYGFDDYTVQWLTTSFFDSGLRGDNYSYPVFGTGPWSVQGNYNFRMCNDSEEHQWLRQPPYSRTPEFQEIESVKQKLCIPNEGDTLYFDKACTIPRIKCEGTWKRSIKVGKADTVIIPDEIPECRTYDVVLFTDTERKVIYIMQQFTNRHSPRPVVGQPFSEWYELIKSQIRGKCLESEANQRNIEALKHSTCTFAGFIFGYKPKEQWLFDVFDGVYPRITREHTLLDLLGGEDDKLTPDFIESITVLLQSKDSESVQQGMRILASMDYAHYPSITRYILKETERNWSLFKPFNSSVKFMLDYIGQYHTPFIEVTADEFHIARDLYKEIAQKTLSKYLEELKKETNLEIDIDYELEIKFPEDQSADETDEDDTELD